MSLGRRSPLLRKAVSPATLERLCKRVVMDLRDNQTCQRCGRTDRRLEWCHVITRNAPSLYYKPWNTLALCGPRIFAWSCHFWFDTHKGKDGEAMKWWSEKFPGRALMLEAWRHDRSRPKIDRWLEKLDLEAEIARWEGA